MIYYILKYPLLHQFQQLQRHLGFGAAEEVDVKDNAGLVARFAQDVALKADEAAAFDADFRSDTQTGGVDGHGHFGVTDHALEREHLRGWYHGEIGFAELVQACSVHHEMEDEGGVAGDGVTHFF